MRTPALRHGEPRKVRRSARLQASPEDEDRVKVVGGIPSSPLKLAEVPPYTKSTDPVGNWVLNEEWPKEYFEPDEQVQAELLDESHYSWLEDTIAQPLPPVVQCVEFNGFRIPRPIKRLPSIRRRSSWSTLSPSSNDNERNAAIYRHEAYPVLLAVKGSFMEQSDTGVTQASHDSYTNLLRSDQAVPSDSLFGDDVFQARCRAVEERNEARVLRSITPYIVPSAEDLAIIEGPHLKCLIEGDNEPWVCSIPVESPRPQPDYYVGFKRTAFSAERLQRLDPVIGTVFDTSFFRATWGNYFPFLTCEVKRSGGELDVADRQNAHSMTIAVRGIVEELDGEILGFSLSHDHQVVSIYANYPVFAADKVTYYGHPIHKSFFSDTSGGKHWTAYRFAKAIYNIWMPRHLERICSAIDQLPMGINFDVLPASDLHNGTPEPANVEPSNINPIPRIYQSNVLTPDTSVSMGLEATATMTPRAKKNRRK